MQKSLNQNPETQLMLGINKKLAIICNICMLLGFITIIKYLWKLAETMNIIIMPFDSVTEIFRYIMNH